MSVFLAIGQFAYFVVAVFTAYYVLSKLGMPTVQTLAREIQEDAQRRAAAILRDAELEARSLMIQRREEIETELDERRQALKEREADLDRRSEQLDRRLEKVRDLELEAEALRQRARGWVEELEDKERELEELRLARVAALRRVAQLTVEEARQLALEEVQRELDEELLDLTMRHERRLRDELRQQATRILGIALQRYAAGHVTESTMALIDLPSDEVKGRIIGRDGRNIRAFERATGVDVVVDDTPGVVMLTSFDPIRREIARRSLEILIGEGRIQPGRIEEVVTEIREALQRGLVEEGRDALTEAGLADHGPTPADPLLEYLGRLKYRISFSQNVLGHSIEVARLCGLIAGELGLDGLLARRCGLFHDLGKAVGPEVEGGHTVAGADLLRRYGEAPEVIHAALGHHDPVCADHPLTAIVAAADALSAARPGARRDTLDRHLRRLEELETVALGFEGVDQAFAVRAGRELRVLVDARAVDDSRAAALCRDIARALREHVATGEIRVVLLREQRFVEIARPGTIASPGHDGLA